MPDALETALLKSPLTKAQRADLWDAYQGAANEDDLAAKLQTFNVPKQVKAQLWDMKMAEAPKVSELAVTPDPETGRVMTRGDIEQQNSLFAPVGIRDVMGGLAMMPAGMGPNLAAMAPGMARVAGPAMNAMKGALKNPVVRAGVGGVAGGMHGGIPGAVLGALEGYAVGKVPGLLGRIVRVAKAALPAAEAAPEAAAEATPAAIAATRAAVRGASTVSPTLSNVTFSVGSAMPEAATTANAVSAVAKAEPATVAGEKVWAVLDAAGNPVQVFKSAGEAVKASDALKAAARAAATVAPAAKAAAEVAPTVAKVAETAPVAATATRQSALMRFAEEAVAKNPKRGQKIWVALDKAGNPVKILTPDQAGAAKRAGIQTTWVKNLWE